MSHSDEVGAGALHGRFSLDSREELHQALPLNGVIPGFAEVSRAPRGSFDGKGLDIGETGFADFGGQVFRTMKVGGCEVRRLIRRIAVLTRGEIGRNNLAKLGIAKETARETVNQRSKARNRGSSKDAIRLQDAARLAQGLDTVRMFNEVIQRSEQEDSIGGVAGGIQAASVTLPDGCQRNTCRGCMRSRLLQMQLDGVN